MVLVKLTGPGGVQRRVHWVVGEMVEIPVTERGTTLCAPGLLHTYEGETVEEALALGMLMNPIHTVIASPEAYEVEGDVVSRDATRAGAHRLLVLRRLDVPTVTIDQCVEIAIRCALVVCNEPSWVLWAEKWLNGEDRTVELARAAQKSAAAARAAELADEAWARAAEAAAEAAVEAARVTAEAWVAWAAVADEAMAAARVAVADEARAAARAWAMAEAWARVAEAWAARVAARAVAARAAARAAEESAAAARAAAVADEAWAAVPIGRIAASVIYGGVK